ncbi:unnamed protein product [Oppiella nova]|uniref:Uncharacterized protein n=1 Tax=Oppiella nova TaxID=334625 RepID=A0A7R9MGW0_9ACAR|nr:unnamed protein product [Oppiella nova]CAG2177021.1 unnamed protein product [Oppiella nova]
MIINMYVCVGTGMAPMESVKRKLDDYGHLRFGRNDPNMQSADGLNSRVKYNDPDYGHMRFVVVNSSVNQTMGDISDTTDPKKTQMDNKYKILQAFELKVKEMVDSQQIQEVVMIDNEWCDYAVNYHLFAQNLITGLKNSLNDALNDRQRVEQLYESEAEKCRQLADALTAKDSETKIAIETQAIEWREQKALMENQLQRLHQQVNDQKSQTSSLQMKCSLADQTIAHKENELQKQNALKASIGSEISGLRDTATTLRNDVNGLAANQTQLKELIQSESDVNSDLKKRLKQRESQLATIQAKNSSLDEQLSELRAKLKANSDLMYEKDVQALRLVQKNELQKQAIDDLREQLQQLMAENESLTKRLTQTNIVSFNLFDTKDEESYAEEVLPSQTDEQNVSNK